MRVWVDITDASSVVFFAPIVRRLEDAGHTVTLTARRFAGADLVLRRYGLGGVLTTRHRGGSLGTRAVGLVNRTAQLLGSASSGRFDVAAGSHASDFVLTAWTLGDPADDVPRPDRLGRSNLVNVRLVDEVAVPEAVPVAGLTSMGATREKLFRYPGFKEEYYLYDARPDPEALLRLGVERRRVVGVVRPAAPPARPPAGEAAPADEAALVRAARGARRPAQRHARRGRARPGPAPAAAGARPARRTGARRPGRRRRPAGRRRLRRRRRRRDAARGRRPRARPPTRSRRPPAPWRRRCSATAGCGACSGPDDIVLRKKDTRTALALPRDPWLFADRLLELGRDRPRRERLGRLVQDAADGQPPPLV